MGTPTPYTWSVFTKPWPHLGGPELAAHISKLGFDGIELPVREGFPVTPAGAESKLAPFARTLADAGLRILSVAGDPDESLFAACSRAGVPVIRVMAPIGSADYLDAEAEVRAQLESLVPLCEQYGVKIAVQQHHGRFVSTSAGLRALLAGLPAEHIAAAWDAGHNGLSGEDADLSLAQLRGRLAMINLKNGYYRRTSEAGIQSWKPVWVTGDEGLSDWSAVAAALTQSAFSGTICLTAQYTADANTDELVRCDLAYAKGIFAG